MNPFKCRDCPPATQDLNDPFGTWRSAARIRVLESDDRVARFFLDAIEKRQVVTLGWSAPWQPRRLMRVQPEELFRAQGHPYVYLTGSCEPGHQRRLFRLDLMHAEGISKAGLRSRWKPVDRPDIDHYFASIRDRWNEEIGAAFLLLRPSDVPRYLRENAEALLWILYEWDFAARMNIFVLNRLGTATFAGLPFAALDLQEVADYPTIRDLVRPEISNRFIRFFHGREIWRETSCRKDVLLEWFKDLLPR